MYYPDLSPYTYMGDEEYHLLGTLNVGWLDKAHPYPQGEVPEGFLDRLLEFCENYIRQTRGFHVCEFCDPPPSRQIRVRRGDEEVWLGSAEIRVVGRGRVCAERIYKLGRERRRGSFHRLLASIRRAFGRKTARWTSEPSNVTALSQDSYAPVYAAPNLIYHYVAEHKYRPPDEFIEAVLQGPLPESPEYKAFKFR